MSDKVKKLSFEDAKNNYRANALNSIKSDIMSLCIFYDSFDQVVECINSCIDEVKEVFG